MLLNTAVENRTQITIRAKRPLAVRLVCRVDIDYEHSVTIVSVSGYSPGRDLSSRRVEGASIHDVLRLDPPPQEIPAIPSPFVVKGPTDTKAKQKERKSNTHPLTLLDADDAIEGQQSRDFRTWHDSTNTHREEAAFVNYKDGIVHLSSSDGTLLQIDERKLAQDDLLYLQSQPVYQKAQRKVTLFSCCSASNLLT